MFRKFFPSLFALILISLQLVSASHAAPFAYITNNDGDTVSVIDMVSDTVVKTVIVGTGPYGIAVNPAGTRVYVANQESDTVSVIDTSSNSVVDTINVGDGPFGVAVNPAGTKVYVTNSNSNSVSVIDTGTSNITSISVGASPYGIAVNPSGTKLYVANLGSNNVSVINTTSDTVVATVPVGTGPYGVVVDPAGTRVYVTNRDNHNVSIIDTASDTVTGSPIPVGQHPCGVAVNPSGTRVYVANWHSDSVSVINTDDNTVASVAVGTFPDGIAVSPDGTRTYVTNYGSDNVSIIDTVNSLVVATATVGDGPIAFGNFIASPPPVTNGLVSLWRGENNAFDAVGGNNGSWNGTPTYGAGHSGNAFSFNGSSSHVAAGDMDNTALSVSFWFKRNSMPHTCGGLVTKMLDGDLSAWAVYLNGNRIHVRTDTTGSGQQYLESSTVFSSNKWYHIAFVYDNVNVRLYVNGVLDQTQTAGAVLNGNDYPITLGSGANGGNLCEANSHFDGLLDEVQIHNRALSPKEVLKMFDPNGPVSWWKGENNAFDSIGENNGTLQGSATYAAGKEGQAFSFSSATNDGVIVPSSADLNPTEAVTMSAWIKPTALNNPWPNIISKRLDSGDIQYSITISDRNTFTCDITGAGVSAEGGHIPLNQWSHVACTYDRNTIRLYVNGEQVASATGSAAIATGSRPLTIGKLEGYDTRNFDGLIDEVKIFNRALTASEVANSYGLVSWWKGDSNPLDSIGINHGAWSSGTPAYASGISGEAFSFDGSGKSVTVPASSNWAFGTGDFAISFWAYSPSFSDHLPLINNRKTGASDNMWAVEIYPVANRVEFHSGLTIFLTASNLLVNSSWNHIAVTRSGSTLSMYINGIPSGSAANSTNFSEINDLQIGRDVMAENDLNGHSFQGLIDDVKVFNRALSADEIANNWPGFAAADYAGGTGSAESPFLIATASQIAKLAVDATVDPAFSAGKYFSLTADIDLAGHQWTPIPEFRGTFDGRGHRILNLTTNNSGTNYQGLFGQINSGASISNLGVINANIVGGTYNGAIAGFASNATVTGCYSTGAITGYSGNGGLVGGAETALTLSYSWSSCAVTGSAAVEGRAWSGGLVGPVWNGTTTISNSFSTGAVITVQNSGGLVALNYSGNLTITNCFVTGNVITSATYWNNVGGIVGLAGPGSSTTVSNCYHSGMISGSDGSGKTGGIIGGLDGGSSVSVNNSYYNSANAAGQGGGTPTIVADMQTAGFVTALNGLQNPLPWLFDSSNTNNGFPILTGMPGSINFIHQSDVPLNSWIVSNPVTVTGFGNPASISISPGGEYSVSEDGGSTWSDFSTTIPATIGPNQQIKVRQTSSGDPLTSTSITLSIGGVSGSFDVTTAAAGDPNATGLVAWWKGENNAYDSVGGNHGSWIGTSAYSAGQVGQAFSFDGTDDNVGVSHNANLNLAGSQTIQLWVYFHNLSQSFKNIIQKGIGTSDSQFYFRTNDSNGLDLSVCNGSHSFYFQSDVPPYTTSFSNLGITADKWHLVTMVLDAPSNMARIYIDGVEKAAVAGIPDARTQNTAGLTIGGASWSNGYFNGLIDEVKIFNRALAATEVSKMAGTYPDAFSFISKTSSTLNTSTVSDPITVTGITQPAPISITGGQYQVNNGELTSNPGTVPPGASVKVHVMSAASFNITNSATLNIGGREGTFSVTTVDIEKPVVNGFSVAVSESFDMTIGVTFTASDNHTVNGYIITTSSTPPLATDPGWSTNAPTTFTLTTAGSNTLYAWAKDPAGNVSNPATATVNLKPVLRGTSNYYTSLQTACGEAISGETVKALSVTVPGSVTISGKSLTIKGGHADGYSTQPGVTTIQGVLTIGTGSLTVDRVAVR